MTEHRQLSTQEIIMMTLAVTEEAYVSKEELDAVFDHLENKHNTPTLQDEGRLNLGMEAMEHLAALKRGEVAIEDL